MLSTGATQGGVGEGADASAWPEVVVVNGGTISVSFTEAAQGGVMVGASALAGPEVVES